jgi:hypothetical protein
MSVLDRLISHLHTLIAQTFNDSVTLSHIPDVRRYLQKYLMHSCPVIVANDTSGVGGVSLALVQLVI